MRRENTLSWHVLHSESPRAPLGLAGRPSTRLSSHCGRPVVLLYGFFGVPSMLGPLAGALSRRGRCVLWFDLGGWLGRFNTSPIDELAEQVRVGVEQLLEQTGSRSIDLVGHSAGGLVGRDYVQRLGGSRYVEQLVTLGTPHRGAPSASLGYFCTGLSCLEQLAPDSDFLRRLRDDEFPAGTRLTSVFSREDRLCPPESCRLDTGDRPELRNVELESGGHLDFLFRKPAIDVVRAELADGSRLRRGEHPSRREGRVMRGATLLRRFRARPA